jgi:hypothetical protein
MKTTKKWNRFLPKPLFLMGMLALVTAFGLMVVGCDDASKTPEPTKSSDNSLVSVAGIVAADATVGTETGTGTTTAVTWAISVPNATDEIGLADIAVATAASFKLYSDAFTTEITGTNTISLTVNVAATAYIKVTAENGTAKYYTVTVTRAELSKTELNAAIAAANIAKNEPVVATVATDVPTGVKWVSASDKATYQTAIDAALIVYNNAGATTNDITTAISDLATATTTFTTAQQDGTGAGITLADKTALLAALNAANNEKSGVLQAATDADHTSPGVVVAPPSAWTTFDGVITTAQAAYDLLAETQTNVDNATSALTTATATFHNAKVTGASTTAVKATLNGKITDAQAAKTGIEISADGNDVYINKQWVTQTVLDTFDGAITAAQGVWSTATKTVAEVTAATGTLETATGTFNTAKHVGLKPLPPTPSGKTYYSYQSNNNLKNKIVFSTVSSGTSGTYTGEEYDNSGGGPGEPPLVEVVQGSYSWNEGALTVTLTPIKIKQRNDGVYGSYQTKAEYQDGIQAMIDAVPGRLTTPNITQLRTFAIAILGATPTQADAIPDPDTFYSLLGAEFGETFTGWTQVYDFLLANMWGGSIPSAADEANREFAAVTYGYSFDSSDTSLFLDESLPSSSETSNLLTGGTFYGRDYPSGGGDYTIDNTQTWVFSDATHYTYTSSGRTEIGTYAYGTDGDDTIVYLKPSSVDGYSSRAAYYASLGGGTDEDKAKLTNGAFLVQRSRYKTSDNTIN